MQASARVPICQQHLRITDPLSPKAKTGPYTTPRLHGCDPEPANRLDSIAPSPRTASPLIACLVRHSSDPLCHAALLRYGLEPKPPTPCRFLLSPSAAFGSVRLSWLRAAHKSTLHGGRGLLIRARWRAEEEMGGAAWHPHSQQLLAPSLEPTADPPSSE